MPTRRTSIWVGAGAFFGAFALAPHIVSGVHFRLAVGDLAPLLVATVTVILCVRNAVDSRGPTRLFWWLLASGLIMWWFNQAGWAWFEVILRHPVPDPFVGDIVLFLHVVPIMAAVAIRQQTVGESEGMLASALNVMVLLLWWILVYAFVIFPDEYIIFNQPIYSRSWDLLFLIEGLILVGMAGWAFFSSQGAWRTIYRNIFLAAILHTVSSQLINNAIAHGTYVSGGVYDLPFMASLLFFLGAAIEGRTHLNQTQVLPSRPSAEAKLAPHLAKVALLSLPLFGYWTLFISEASIRLQHIRFAVAMAGVAGLAFLIFLKQHLLDRRLVQLLRKSHESYATLQRLHSRVIQQEKLASLGELIALAASELDYPLSEILTSSERLAACSNLKSEQLSIAQKIGQQARRTRELVNDLLSFAQQTPGDKVPLDLKPLVQRAVQMEGFKVDSREITLTVHSQDQLPRVQGNSNQLLQAFLQIVENAVEALEESGGGQLLISLRRDEQEVVLEFADTGPGLSNPERVFDPFYTTKPVGKGTGLGLSATYGVIRDHKGQISCHNRPEGGAVFEIRLPLIKTGAGIAEVAAQA